MLLTEETAMLANVMSLAGVLRFLQASIFIFIL